LYYDYFVFLFYSISIFEEDKEITKLIETATRVSTTNIYRSKVCSDKLNFIDFSFIALPSNKSGLPDGLFTNQKSQFG
jgi:hypothetical protein